MLQVCGVVVGGCDVLVVDHLIAILDVDFVSPRLPGAFTYRDVFLQLG